MCHGRGEEVSHGKGFDTSSAWIWTYPDREITDGFRIMLKDDLAKLYGMVGEDWRQEAS